MVVHGPAVAAGEADGEERRTGRRTAAPATRAEAMSALQRRCRGGGGRRCTGSVRWWAGGLLRHPRPAGSTERLLGERRGPPRGDSGLGGCGGRGDGRRGQVWGGAGGGCRGGCAGRRRGARRGGGGVAGADDHAGSPAWLGVVRLGERAAAAVAEPVVEAVGAVDPTLLGGPQDLVEVGGDLEVCGVEAAAVLVGDEGVQSLCRRRRGGRR